jgi:hypothetical protein
MEPWTDTLDALIGEASAKRISPGDAFPEQVLRRWAERSESRSIVPGFLTANRNLLFLALVILLNSVSIGVGLHEVVSGRQAEKSSEPPAARVYYLDPSPSQLYTHIK